MINKVILIGNLGADPELQTTSGGNLLCTLRLATSEKWKDSQGEQQERTEWHRVKVWGRQAENCNQYLQKGSKAYIEGKISYGSYEKEGHTFYTSDIVAKSVQFLDSRGQSDSQGGGYQQNQSGWGDGKRRGGARHVSNNPPQNNYNPPPPDDDDIPF